MSDEPCFGRDDIGDSNGVLSYSDYLEAWEYLDYLGEEAVAIYTPRVHYKDMKCGENLIEKQDLLMGDTSLDTFSRYALFTHMVKDGRALYDGVPVYIRGGLDVVKVEGSDGTMLEVNV